MDTRAPDDDPSVLDRDPFLSGGAVLVVDDDPATRAVCREILGPRCRVEEASDGVEALEALNALDSVRLVITDVRMPRLDGIGLVRALRADPRFARVPVIVQTADEEILRENAFSGLSVERVMSKADFRRFLRERVSR